MKQSILSRPVLLLSLLSSIVFGFITAAWAEEAPLNTLQALPAVLEDQEMRIIEVQMAPGEVSPPHRHNAYVYVYMLEGEVEMQVRGGPIVTLKPGDTFYESPDDIHQLGRNTSSTESAKFLVHMLKQVGAPASELVD